MDVRQTIWFNIAMSRVYCIIHKLAREQHFVLDEHDYASMRLLMQMVMSTTNSNELIIKDFLDMHKVSKEFSAKIS